MKLVDVTTYLPEVIIDLRYASPRNITGKILYGPATPARLAKPAAGALQQAARTLSQEGFRLVIWDAYRPEGVQMKLRAVNRDPHYVAQESKHCKGLAVDVTLATTAGTYLDMGTDHDEFTPSAHANAQDISTSQQHNRRVLKTAMEAAGFQQWPYEWWHFDYAGE